jgi:hypothetical protein
LHRLRLSQEEIVASDERQTCMRCFNMCLTTGGGAEQKARRSAADFLREKTND